MSALKKFQISELFLVPVFKIGGLTGEVYTNIPSSENT